MNAVVFILLGLFAIAQAWPKLGRSVAGLFERLAKEQRLHSDALDRAYRAYAETPARPTGLDRHWQEVDELEGLYRQ